MRIDFELDAPAVVTAGVFGVVGLFALHAAFPGLYDYWPKSSSDLASWVQAVGAMGSIVYAGRLLGRQLKHAEAQHLTQRNYEVLQNSIAQMEADLGMIRACSVVASQTVQALESVARKMAGEGNKARTPQTGLERLESLQQVVNVLLGKNIPVNALMPLLQLAREIAYSLTALRMLPSDYVPSASDARAVAAKNRSAWVAKQLRGLEILQVMFETDLHKARMG